MVTQEGAQQGPGHVCLVPTSSLSASVLTHACLSLCYTARGTPRPPGLKKRIRGMWDGTGSTWNEPLPTQTEGLCKTSRRDGFKTYNYSKLMRTPWGEKIRTWCHS